MVRLDLTQDEANTLIQVLEYYISDLRMEVADTDRKDTRDALKVEERDLKKILETLRASAAKA